MFTRQEKYMLLEALDKQISYRLKNQTLLSEVNPLRKLKKKIEDSVKSNE